MGSSRLERWIGRKFRLRHLELIAEVYDCRSILKASRRLSLTQPTVTKALQDVEATLGLKLFERSNRGIEPTEYGEIFARHAKVLLAQLRHAADELENLRVGYSGKVSVGTLLAASASILPDAMVLLKKERPGVAISVIVGTYDILMPSLLAGDLDMVLGRLPAQGRSRALVYEEFYTEPICVVARRPPVMRVLLHRANLRRAAPRSSADAKTAPRTTRSDERAVAPAAAGDRAAPAGRAALPRPRGRA